MACIQCGGALPSSKQLRKFCSKRCRSKASNDAMMQRQRTDPEFHAKRTAAQRTRYHADPEAARQRMQQWRKEHPEMWKAIERRAQTKNSDAIRARNRAAHHANKAQRNKNRSLLWEETRQQTPWIDIVRQARVRCMQKGKPFNLTEEWIRARWTGRCELTDIPFQCVKGKRNFYSPSLDQIIPNKGYTQDNCRFILWALNAFKHSGTDEDMQTVIRVLAKKYNLA